MPSTKRFSYVLLFNSHVSPLRRIHFCSHFVDEELKQHQLVSCSNSYKLRCLNDVNVLPDSSGGLKSQMG